MKLRLKGAKGILAGPGMTWDGLPEIEIDFTDRMGLTALAGENGCGKSSVLENLHFYPQLVSRDGALWQHFTGRNAEKEFEADFMGRHYRSLIKMDCEAGKQEGFLWIDGQPVCNGKITAYKEKVSEIFGSPFTYFRSQFCPQKSKKTTDMQIENMTTGVFRELLREFLNLQRYAQYEDSAKQAGNVLEGMKGQLESRLLALNEMTAERMALDYSIPEAKGRESDLVCLKDVLWRELLDKRTALDILKVAIQKNALALERKKDLQTQIERLETEMATEKATAAGEIKALQDKWAELKQAIKACDAILQDRGQIEKAAELARDLENSLVVLQGEIDLRTGEEREEKDRLQEMEKGLAEWRQKQKDLADDKETLELNFQASKLNGEYEAKKKVLRDLENDAETNRLIAELQALDKRSAERDLYSPNCTDFSCAAIAEAVKAKEQIPEAEERINARAEEVKKLGAEAQAEAERLAKELNEVHRKAEERGRWIKNQGEVARQALAELDQDLRNVKQVLSNLAALIAEKRKKLAANREEAEKQKVLAGKLPEIQVAEQRKGDLEKQLAETAGQGKAKAEAWQKREGDLRGHIELNQDNIKALVIDEKADAALLTAQAEIKEIEGVKIPAIEKEIQGAREKIATLQAELARIEAAEKDLAEVQEQKDRLFLKISRWRYLQLGCSKTGLQNLRIGGAAPTIVNNANKLLVGAYNNKYSINLVTQDEEGKEVLDIKILLPDGREVFLDDISGGQRTWCVQALWLAMSLLNQEKGGRKYDYFCADENDGALDLDNAEKFTALYRPFMAEAELERIIYISHKASCRAMADNVLTFEHGKNPSWG